MIMVVASGSLPLNPQVHFLSLAKLSYRAEPRQPWLGSTQAWLPPPGTWVTKGNWLGRAGGNHVLSQLWLGLVGRGLERPLLIGVLSEEGSGSLGPKWPCLFSKEGLAGCSAVSPCMCLGR